MLAGARIRISALLPASTAPALGLKDFSFGCAHTSSGDPVTIGNLPHLCAEPSRPSRGHAHFLTREATPLRLPPRPRPWSPVAPPSRAAEHPPRAPETPQRMPVRDRDVTRASLVLVGVFVRSRSRVAALSWLSLSLSRCRYPLGLHHVPQQQPEAALDLCERRAAGAPAGRRQPQIQVQSGG